MPSGSTILGTAPVAARAPLSSTAWSGASGGAPRPVSTVGDAIAAAGTGFVLLSLLLTWYRVTITAVGVQFYQSLERALFAHLFPQATAALGGLAGPLTFSVSALGKEAGGWRWAILVVSIVLLLEVLLANGTGVARQVSPTWPHAATMLVLTVANLILVAAAFFNQPYSDAPSTYLSVSHGIGAYLGLAACLVACGGAVARLAKGPGRVDAP